MSLQHFPLGLGRNQGWGTLGDKVKLQLVCFEQHVDEQIDGVAAL